MLEGHCHCGAVNYLVKKPVKWITECNCSICRKLGVLWAHADESEITLDMPTNATYRYIWGDKTLAFHCCKTCLCITHWSGIDDRPSRRMAVNARLASKEALDQLPLRHFDGADTFEFLD